MAAPVRRNQPAEEAPDSPSALQAAIDAIKPVSEATSPARLVVYARNGVGKTRFGASGGKKTLILCADPAGVETLKRFNAPNVFYREITAYEQLDPYYWAFQQGLLDHEILVFDTWTMMTTMCLRMVMGQVNNRDPLTPKTDDWQKLAQIMNNDILNKWAFLPSVDIVWLCQERNFTSKKEGEEDETVDQIGPATSPSVANTLIGAVGVVGHLFKQQVIGPDGKLKSQRRMRFEDPQNLYIAKSRVYGLPTIMANPTLKSILDIREANGELPADETLYLESTAIEDDEREQPELTQDESGVQTMTL